MALELTPVASNIKPMPSISLVDMMNIARGAQAYQQAEQIYPEVAAQQKIKTQADAMTLAANQFKQIADSQISMINNPLVLKAEQEPGSVDPKQLVELVESRGMTLAKSLGIPEDKARDLIAPYSQIAQTNPGGLRQFYKERHILGLDQASRTSALAPSGVPITTGAGGYTVQTGEFGPVKPGTVIPGTEYQQLLGPGSIIDVTTEKDVNNQNVAFVRSADGKQVIRTVVPSGTPPGQYPLSAPAQPRTPPGMVTPTAPSTVGKMPLATDQGLAAPVMPPPGESPKTGEVYQAEIIESRKQVQPARNAVDNIRTIRQYLPLAQTGRYSEAIAGLQSVLGNVAGSKPEELAAAARDIIEKNIADLALQKNSALSGKFAADLAAVQSSLATAGKNPTAIAKVMEQLEPLMQHVANYSTGLERAVAKSPNKFYAKPEFDRAMNEAYDPLALRMKNAFDSGGQEGLNKWLKANNVNLTEQQLLLQKLQAYGRLVRGE